MPDWCEILCVDLQSEKELHADHMKEYIIQIVLQNVIKYY